MGTVSARPAIETRLRLSFEVDTRATLAPLWQASGPLLMRFADGAFVRATHTATGPASVRVRVLGRREVAVEAWGDGAAAAVDALPEVLGAGDEPAALVPHHRIVGELARRHAGLRLVRTGAVFDALLPAIVGQKVTVLESRNSFRAIVARYGEPAPGPFGLRLPPRPEVLAAQPYWAFHRLGLEQRRADVVRRSAARARALEAGPAIGSAETRRRLLTVPGIGPWTAAETVRLALGDPDAISVGDYHLPSLVSWALAGEPRGTDERMLELLSPYEGQRARVALLLEMSGLRAPRYGPRLAPRSIVAI